MIADTLIQARSVLLSKNWVKGTAAQYKDGEAISYCEQGALLEPIGCTRQLVSSGLSVDGRASEAANFSVTPNDPELFEACCWYLAKGVMALYPDRLSPNRNFSPAAWVIAEFNDHSDTKLDDVLATYDEAIRFAKEDGS